MESYLPKIFGSLYLNSYKYICLAINIFTIVLLDPDLSFPCWPGHRPWRDILLLMVLALVSASRVLKFKTSLQASKIALVHSYLRVPPAAGQVKILIFLILNKK